MGIPARLRRWRPALLAAMTAVAAFAAIRVAWSAPPPSSGEPPSAGPYHRIHVIDFEGEIGAPIAAYVERRMDAAKADKADCIVFRIESPGGTIHHGMEISQAVLALPKSIHAVAWIPKYSYSAAALLTLACDEIVMAPQSSLGDCQPIFLNEKGFTPAGEKIETVLRAEFRKYAKENGWPPLLAEKLVSVDLDVVLLEDRQGGRHYADGEEFRGARDEDLIDGMPKSALRQAKVAVGKGKLLTMSADEAKEFGFAGRILEKESDLLDSLKAPDAAVTYASMTFSEEAGRWLLGVSGVLSALLIICVMLTVFQGVGTPTIVGGVALALMVLVTLTADLANGFAFLLIAVGALALLAEIFIIPGFGVAGIVGILALLAGFLCLTTGVTFESSGSFSWSAAGTFGLQFAGTVIGAAVLFTVLARFFPAAPFARRMLLAGAGLPTGAAVEASIRLAPGDKAGVATTALRPAGRATIGGAQVDVVSEGGFVEPGTALVVVRVEGSRVFVRPSPTSHTTRPS